MAGFRDIIGHEQIIAHLKTAVALGRVSHAYIFNGPELSGKRMLADAFAMTLQCETERGKRIESAEPCMTCPSCKKALSGSHPDILYLAHEKPGTISVGDIREQINGNIDVKPYSSRYKVYIVDEAEKMNQQAQNALLKTIEEPPAYAVILLLTTNADAFLPTIRSRCVMLDLKAVEDRRICRHLMKHCQVPDYRAELCAAFAQGNVGRAMLLAESDRFNELKDFAMQLMRRLPGIPDYELLQELKPLEDFKEEIGDFLDLLTLLFRDVLLYKAAGDVGRLIFRGESHEIAQQAKRFSYRGLQDSLEAVETARRRIRANVNFELTLELLLLRVKQNTGMEYI